jgi:hypothetical protein
MTTELAATEPASDQTVVQEPAPLQATEGKPAATPPAAKTKPAPKKRVAKKSPAKNKKKKRVAKKKAAAQKHVAKKASAKKKKSASKKRATQKSPAKRVAKESVVKKPAVKKRSGKKPAKRAVAAKKSVTKKITAKRSVPRKRKTKKQLASKGTNKAQAIRGTAKELGGKPRPKDVIAALATKGIKVASAQVSTVLKAAGLRRGRRRRNVMAVVVPKPSSNGHVSFLHSALGLGLDKAIELLQKVKAAVK